MTSSPRGGGSSGAGGGGAGASASNLALALTRFHAAQSRSVQHPELEALRQQLARLEDVAQGLQDVVLEGSVRTQRLETLTEGLTTQVLGFEHALNAKVGLEQLHSAERRCTALQRQADELAQAYTADMKGVATQTKLLDETVRSLSAKSLSSLERLHKLETDAEGTRKQMEELQASFAGRNTNDIPRELEAHLPSFEEFEMRLTGALNSLQEKADLGYVQHVEDMIQNLQGHVSDIEQAVQAKASFEQLQQLNRVTASASVKTAALHESIRKKAEFADVEQLHSTVAALCKQVDENEQLLQGKADMQQLEQFEGALMDLHARVAAEQQEKIGINQIQELVNMIHSVDAKCDEAKQVGNQLALHGDEGASKMLQLERLVMRVQAQVMSLEVSLQEKVDKEQLTPLRATVDDCRKQIFGMEELIQDRPERDQLQDQMQQLEEAVSVVDRRLSLLSQGLQEKADSSQVQELNNTITGIQSKICGIKAGVFEVVDSVQTIQGVIVALKKQMSTMERSRWQK